MAIDEEAKTESTEEAEADVRSARLKPIRVVERELTRPDGTKVRVEVPVYPPFRLEERPTSAQGGTPKRSSARKPAAKPQKKAG